MQTTATAIGRLMKKTQRHEACSTIQPPSTGPSAAVMDANPDQAPIARPRSLSGNDALSNARLPGTSNAAPAPGTPRAMISEEIDGGKPHAAAPNANTTRPRMQNVTRAVAGYGALLHAS